MTQKQRALYSGQQKIQLNHPIGAGREGTVHPVSHDTELAVKLIGASNPDPEKTAKKLEVMVEHPPSATTSRHYRITWPAAIIRTPKRRGKTVGYIMPMLDPSRYHPIGSYLNPARRRKLTTGRKQGYTYLHLLLMARNLAKATAHLHAHGAVLGDINSRNVLATDQGRIAVIDTDSFQIKDPKSGETHRCLVGTPEYTPPRLQGEEFADTDRTEQDDLFSLAVMLYQLMVQGAHPYSGTRTETATGTEVDNIADRITHGNFAHLSTGTTDFAATQQNELIWTDLPLKRQFNTAFQSKRPRTSATEWAQAITHVAHSLTQCRKNSLHWHFRRYCTWCRYRRLTGIEPFPTPEEAGKGRTSTKRL